MIMFFLDIFQSWLGTALIGVAIFYLIKQLLIQKPKEYVHGEKRLKHFSSIPSPRGYPILGNFTQLGSYPHLTLTKWSNDYGPLYCIKMGFQEVVIVSGLETIRTALTKHSLAFAGRPKIETLNVDDQLGIAFSDYSPEWMHQKNVAIMAMTLFTTGKDPNKFSEMETSSYKHASNLVDQLLKTAKQQKNVVDPCEFILANVTNAICKVCFGEEFELDDPTLKELIILYHRFDEAMGISQTANFWPILKYFPFVSQSFKHMRNFQIFTENIIISSLDRHLKTFDQNNLRDLVDCLYSECGKESNKSSNPILINQKKTSSNLSKKIEEKPLKDFLEEILSTSSKSESERLIRNMYNIGDLFVAGFDTFFTIIHWFFLYMAVFPETQVKLREEIEDIIPPDEQPSFRLHASKCNYTIAWMYELMRHVSPLPILLPHSTVHGVELENYYIPSGKTVHFNTYQAHHDPALWDKPEEFRPERFLDENKHSFNQSMAANVLAWGIGKRVCPGKELSKHEMFIFICSILRRLEIKQAIPGIEPVLPWPVDTGLTVKPHKFRVKILER